MARLYEAGLSLAKVGRKLGFNASTVLAPYATKASRCGTHTGRVESLKA